MKYNTYRQYRDEQSGNSGEPDEEGSLRGRYSNYTSNINSYTSNINSHKSKSNPHTSNLNSHTNVGYGKNSVNLGQKDKNSQDYYSQYDTDTKYSDNPTQLNQQKHMSFFDFILAYIQIRSRQIFIYLGLISRLSGEGLANLKNILVRNMYWGRTSFYKTSFHLLVIFITLTALYTGLGSRIVATQKDILQNVSVSERLLVDSDIISQQGSFIPLDEFDNESDSLYVEYTVVAGDSLSKIAAENEINGDTIRWANNIPLGRDTLRVGQVIKIPKLDGVLYTIKDGDTIDKILAQMQLKDKDADRLTFVELNAGVIGNGEKLKPGSVVFLPDATLTPPKSSPIRRPSSGGGVSRPPTTPSVPSAPAGKFINPLKLCRYNYTRGYKYSHTGVDLATPSGCKVVAAKSGIIARAGWCATLGYCVQIIHSGGYSTIYGHGNGVMYVKVGQNVDAGQVIMQSGCTGRCSGPHVHISIAKDYDDVFNCYHCRIDPKPYIPW